MTSHDPASRPELTAVRQAHRFDESRLAVYLAEHGLLEGELGISQFEGGQSNPTFLLETTRARYVLRKQPPGEILPSAHRVDREYRVMAALADTSAVPVPAMHLYCDDPALIGTPFYVMDYVPGQVFSDPALPDLSPEARRRVHHGLIDTMAALHSVDVAAVGLSDFGRPDGYIERQIRLWRRQYEASIETVDDNMARLGDWLSAHVPSDPPPAIAHGDFRVGNLLLAEDVSHVVAVLDWELATLGHPLADLAYACMPYHLPPGTAGIAGVQGLDLAALGIPSEAEQIERYRAARGIAPIDDWPVYLAFSLYRMAAILQGVYARARAGNASSAQGLEVGAHAGLMAERGWQIAQDYD